MDMLGVVFPTIMYILGSILLVVLIVFIIRAIITLDKINLLLDDISNKVKSLDGIFNAINMTSSAISAVGDRLLEKVVSIFSKLSSRRKRKKRKGEEIYE